MSDSTRDEKKALFLIDTMIRELSGGDADQAANKQGISDNQFTIEAENIGRDVVHFESNIDTNNIDVDYQSGRYNTIRLFAEVGNLVSNGVEENEEGIKEKLTALAKIGMLRVLPIVCSILLLPLILISHHQCSSQMNE